MRWFIGIGIGIGFRFGFGYGFMFGLGLKLLPHYKDTLMHFINSGYGYNTLDSYSCMRMCVCVCSEY